MEELAENKLIDKGSDHRQELEELGVWEQEFEVITCQLGQTPRLVVNFYISSQLDNDIRYG